MTYGPQPATHNYNLCVALDARMVYYRRAGIGQYAMRLLRALSECEAMGPDSRVLMLQMRGHKQPIVSDRRFRRVPMWTPPHNRFEQWALAVELLKLRPRPRLMHCPDFVPPFHRPFPAVVNIHDLAFLKFPELTLLTPESRRYYSQVYSVACDAEALIALSHSARDDIIQLLGADPQQVEVIPLAAGEEFVPPLDPSSAQLSAAREFGLPAPEEGGYILFVSTIEPRKNLLTLLEAYKLVLERGRILPMPVLALAGQKGWLYEKIYARIDELRLASRVRLPGEVPGGRLVRLYQGARVFVFPSLYEGFGLPVLEALACGVPVISSTGGALPEVVGAAGILLDPHDVEAWADAMERVLGDEAEQARLRDMGPRQAARFSWVKVAAQTWALYGRVAG